MTCREKMKVENPDYVNDKWCGGVCGCPSSQNWLPDPVDCCKGSDDEICRKCWDREIPGTEPTPQNDNVNHPNHYTHGGIECIDAMESAFGIEAVQHFCACNAFKYIFRFLHKNGMEDIDKAIWYLNKFKALEDKRHD